MSRTLTYQQAVRLAASITPCINLASFTMALEAGAIRPTFIPRRVFREEDVLDWIKQQSTLDQTTILQEWSANLETAVQQAQKEAK